MIPISFKRHRFPPVVIRHAVWLYARFTLSFRDVEELLAERSIDVSNETVRRWFMKFGQLIARNLRRNRPRPSGRWHLDEMVINIRGRKHWLWRAVDGEGEVLDFLVQRRRCARTIELKTHTSRFGGESESSSGSSRPDPPKRVLSIHAAVYNTFYVQRHLLPRRNFKDFCAETFAVWQQSCLAT